MTIANIRVHVNKRYHEVYRQLIGQSLYPKIFNQHTDVFTLCACLGFRGDRAPQNKKSFLFWSDAFSSEQQTVLKAMAVRGNGDYDYGILDRPEDLVRVVEDYADGGMEILIEQVLGDFLRDQDADVLSLDYNDHSQVEKAILAYVQSELNKDPLAS